MKSTKNILVENIVLDIECSDNDAVEKAKAVLAQKNMPDEMLQCSKIYRKSIDTRHKNNIKFVYSVLFNLPEIIDCGKYISDGNNSIKAIESDKNDKDEIVMGSKPQNSEPVVIGFGPAGMFCALVLSMHGYKPVVFEMGDKMDSRIKKTERLFRDGILDEKTNVCFGEGGAGTFSDGKLITRISGKNSKAGKNRACDFVLRKFAEYGASKDILYKAKPHVGTDKIRTVTENIRNAIIANGGKIYFSSELTDINIVNIKSRDIAEITINNSEQLHTDGLFLAIGHSAFRTYGMLLNRGFILEPKPYSVGLRIEHKQSYIDRAVYGKFAGHKNLPPAEYLLSHTKGKANSRGVYTFCMCPGGIVVNSSTESGGIVTNGMSYSNRNLDNANAAIAVSVYPEDYGGTVDGAFKFRRAIEEAAYKVRGRNFAAPVQTLGDFMSGTVGKIKKSAVQPSYTGETVECDINKLFPEFVCNAIKEGVAAFDKTLKGYYNKDAVLTAPETRTSSAVRIMRDSEKLTAINCDCVYPMGEGAGYAGGITSSAVDGINCALKYMSVFSPGD